MPAKKPVGPSVAIQGIEDLTPDSKNANLGTQRGRALLEKSLRSYGAGRSILVDRAGRVIAGNKTLEVAAELGLPVKVVRTDGQALVVVQRDDLDLDDAAARELALADNRVAELDLAWDPEVLAALEADGVDVAAFWRDDELADILDSLKERPARKMVGTKLADRFVIPPFSVLDLRRGDWLERKHEWLALGIQSEIGRGANLTYNQSAQTWEVYELRNQMREASGVDPSWPDIIAEARRRGLYVHDGTSIFDPVLCELAYRWFCPPGGLILDPFAGGSVRGIVAASLERRYVGIDLSREQVRSNIEQWEVIGRADEPAGFEPDELTPIESWAGVLVKRDDLCEAAFGAWGGKSRTCLALAAGATGLVTAGSRQSPQVNIVAQVARKLGIPCRVHVPEGPLTPELEMAAAAGAEVVQHKAGRNSVIKARAREDAEASGWREIPFGMECAEAIEQTARQVGSFINEGLWEDGRSVAGRRIVVPVGSGMSLAGILHGLRRFSVKVPVLGVRVGADPTKILDAWAPEGWRDMVEIIDSGLDYHDAAPAQRLGDLVLDPIYEAKCLPFLRDGDLLWCVGIRETARPRRLPPPAWIEGDSNSALQALEPGFDFVFTCPPYYDLEVYSDDPADLSRAKTYEAFRESLAAILESAVRLLKPDRFAAIVVGEIRDPKTGYYRGFVPDVVEIMEAAGAAFYNEAILVTPLGSLPIRTGKQFSKSRKLGKTHQQMLVFVKGDPVRAVEACGPVEVAVPEQEVEDA